MSKTDPNSSYVFRPGRGRLFCYKDHLSIDSHKRVITAIEITLGAVTEDHILEELLDKQPVQVKEVCGDSQYVSAYNYALCGKGGKRPSMPKGSSPRKKDLISFEQFLYDA